MEDVGERSTRRSLLRSAAVFAAFALAPVALAGDEISIRLIRITAHGKSSAAATVGPGLEAVRSQVEALPAGYEKYDLIGKPEVRRGSVGATHSFQMPNGRTLEVTPSPDAKKRIKLHLRVLQPDRKTGKPAEVFSLDLFVKDGGTAIHKSDLKLEDGSDLLYALTASTGPL